MLVVYCLVDTQVLTAPHGLPPELIGSRNGSGGTAFVNGTICLEYRRWTILYMVLYGILI